MASPKTHPNNGATTWAVIPDDQVASFNETAVPVQLQEPAGRRVFVIAASVGLEKAQAAFDALRLSEPVVLWHVRNIPGKYTLIADKAWDRHPAFNGPVDSQVYVCGGMQAPVAAPAPPPEPPPEPLVRVRKTPVRSKPVVEKTTSKKVTKKATTRKKNT